MLVINFLKFNFKKNKGFTLIELMIVIFVSGIILIALGGILVSSFNFFNNIEEEAKTQGDIRFLTEYLRNKLRYTKKVKLEDDFSAAVNNLNPGEEVIGIENQKVRFKKDSSTSREIIEINKSVNIYFNKDNNIPTLILVINGDSKEIILNNCDSIDNNTNVTNPKAIKFSY